MQGLDKRLFSPTSSLERKRKWNQLDETRLALEPMQLAIDMRPWEDHLGSAGQPICPENDCPWGFHTGLAYPEHRLCIWKTLVWRFILEVLGKMPPTLSPCTAPVFSLFVVLVGTSSSLVKPRGSTHQEESSMVPGEGLGTGESRASSTSKPWPRPIVTPAWP